MISFTHSKTLICIEATVEGYEYLCQGVLLGSEVVILDPNQDGIEQITQVLRDRIHNSTAPRIQTLHIVSHGSPGCLYLGNTQLSLDTLDQYTDELQQWSGALTTDAEILLYGCNVGQADNQQSYPHSNLANQSSFTSGSVAPFIQKLQHLTGAKIAASSTPIGSKKQGGNWQLDVQTDQILSPLAFTQSTQENYAGVLATFTVENTNDEGDGSLRDAIAQANASNDPAGDIIEFDPTVFGTPQTINLLSQLTPSDDDGSGLTINGPGANLLTLSRADNDGNLFQVTTDTEEAFVRISGVTIQNGNIGIRYPSNVGTLRVDNSVVRDNNRFGIRASSKIEITNSSFENNNQIAVRLFLGNDSVIQGNTFITTNPEAGQERAIVVDPNNDEVEITGVQIIDNFIGTNANGDPGLGQVGDNGGSGAVEITAATGTQVIGNVISGNTDAGLLVNDGSTDVVIQGNRIGVTPDGTTALPNATGIIIEDSTGTIIGGTDEPAQRNIISGNTGTGILVDPRGNASDNNQILGNYIGVNAAGDTAIPNTGEGIDINASAQNTIAGNVISGNQLNGILIRGLDSTANTVQGNLIGLDATGANSIPNQNNGIAINNAANNTIGGQEPEQGNTIAFNTGDGISIVNNASIGNGILGNNIFSNGEGDETAIGIDLGDDGVTPNDDGDADVGPNNLQNYPQLIQAELAGTDTIITGTFNSTPATPYRLEFFSNEAADPSGNGQGRTFVGAIEVTTDAAGNAPFTETLLETGDLSGQLLTATATDPSNNTSEFSNAAEISVPSITVTPAGTSLPEGDSGTVDHVYTVEISTPTRLDTVINYSTSDGTATLADNDYIESTGSLTFPANPTRSEPETQTITVQVNGDLNFEADEVFNLNLSKEGSGNLEATELTGTIENDDPEPGISVSNITVNEGDAVATFTLTTSEASGFAASFDYETRNVTAFAGVDYTVSSGNIEIPIGETTVTVEVPLGEDDGLEEPDKSFEVVFSNFQGIITESESLTATATILDNDFSPVLNLDTDGDYETTFTEGGEAVAIAADVTISDQDSTNLTNATITLENPLDHGNETLSIVGPLPDGITTSGYDPVSGRLTLTGEATVEAYQTAFSQIVYNNTSNTPDLKPRIIESIVSDGVNPSKTVTTTINITPVNTPPIANDDAIVTRTNTSIISNITSNDFDLDGEIDPSTVELDETDLDNQGEVTIDPQGNLTFTPATGVPGTVEIPYTVQDNEGESASAQVSITVNPDINQPPFAANLATEIIPNTSTPVAIPALAANDFDGTITSFQITRLPQNGQLQLNDEIVTQSQTISVEDAGNLTFTPLAGFVGFVEFEYTAFDDDNASDLTPATVVIPVSGSSPLPVAGDKIASPNSPDNTPVPIPELMATSAVGEITSYQITKFPVNSTLLLNGQPLTTPEVAVTDVANLSYIGGEDFSGDSFYYTAINSEGLEDLTPAQVILPPAVTENQLPVTADQIGPIIPNVSTPVPLPALQGTDADGEIASFTITKLPVGGQLLVGETEVVVDQVIPVEEANQLTFIPDADFSGLTHFSYAATDNEGDTDSTPATYNLFADVTNTPPLPSNLGIPFVKNLSTQVPLPALTTANNEDIASFTLVELPVGGQVFLNGQAVSVNQSISVEQAGQLTFNSDIDFSGSTSLKFTATDTTGTTSPLVGEVSVFILPNLLPTVQPLTLSNLIPTSVPIPLPPLSGTDEDGEIVNFALNNIPTASEGQLFLDQIPVFNLNQVSQIPPEQAGSLQFEANGNFAGDIIIDYVARDNDGQSSEPAAITINILPQTPSLDFSTAPSEPVAEELIVSEIPNDGTAIEIPPLTANDLNGEVVSFSIVELFDQAVGQLLLDGVVVTSLSQVTELTIDQASQLTFIPSATFSGQIQLRYTATNSFGLTSSSSRIVLNVPSISSEISTLPTDLPLEVLAFTSSLAGLLQSYTFITESIALNPVDTSIEGTEIDDILIGSDISEQIVGLGGNDEIQALAGNDNAFGNTGDDTVDAGDGNDVVEGGVGEDFVIGGIGNDTVIGGDGNDTVVGGSNLIEVQDTEGDDLIDGGEGDDQLFGNQGDDTLIGGDGNDEIFSGKDNDLASGEDGNDTIFGDLGDDSLSGGDGNDFLLGNQGNDTISGGDGNDFIAGGQDNDLLFGDDGDDEVYGDLGEDSVYGNQGNDRLFGGEGNDSVIGGDGEDFLSGDGGDDILVGGEGADVFALLLNSGSDVIQDFADGEDSLGLSLGVSFDDLTIEQSETGTLIRFDGQLLVTLNRINLTLITEDDFTTI